MSEAIKKTGSGVGAFLSAAAEVLKSHYRASRL
jgi:hypothetical protein